MTAASLITQARLARAFSQAELARRSRIPRTAINAYERGHRQPTAPTLARLLDACDMSLQAAPRPSIDLHRNDRALQDVLDLAELLPSRREGPLTFPPLPAVR